MDVWHPWHPCRQVPNEDNEVDTLRMLPTKPNQVHKGHSIAMSRPHTMSGLTPPSSQLKRSRDDDDDDHSDSKRVQRTLSQVSEPDDDRTARSHARKDGAVLDTLEDFGWDLETDTKDQQLAADILYAVLGHNVIRRQVHPDWAVNPIADSKQRLAFFEKALSCNSRLTQALFDAFKDKKFKSIWNAGMHALFLLRFTVF